MSTPTAPGTPLTVTLNGEPRPLPAPLTVAELLAQCGFPANGVAVAVNGQFVPRTQRAERRLAHGDQIECVAPMQGG